MLLYEPKPAGMVYYKVKVKKTPILTMEENTKKGGQEGCGCECSGKCDSGKCGDKRGGMCGHWGGGRHRILRVIIGLLILMVAFWAGVKLGELKSSLEGGFYGGRHMNSGRFLMMQGGNGWQAPYGMMGGSANTGNRATSSKQ